MSRFYPHDFKKLSSYRNKLTLLFSLLVNLSMTFRYPSLVKTSKEHFQSAPLIQAVLGSISPSKRDDSPRVCPAVSLWLFVNHWVLRSSAYFSGATAFKLCVFLILSSFLSSSKSIRSSTSKSSSSWLLSSSISSCWILLSVSTL